MRTATARERYAFPGRWPFVSVLQTGSGESGSDAALTRAHGYATATSRSFFPASARRCFSGVESFGSGRMRSWV